MAEIEGIEGIEGSEEIEGIETKEENAQQKKRKRDPEEKDFHSPLNFLLLGTALEMYEDCNSKADLLTKMRKPPPANLFSRSKKFSLLYATNPNILMDELNDYSPSQFASSNVAKRDAAMRVLDDVGLSPIISQPYSQLVFWNLLIRVKSTTTPEQNYLKAAQHIYNICNGENKTIYPGIQAATLLGGQNNLPAEEFRTSICCDVLDVSFPNDIIVSHQRPVNKAKNKSITVDICQSRWIDMIPSHIGVIYKFKCNKSNNEGPLYEAYVYGLHLMKNQGTNKILLFVIHGTTFSVHGQYWSGDVCYLAELQSNKEINENECKTFASWLSAGVHFSQNANFSEENPPTPWFLNNSHPCYSCRQVYYHERRFYKVYDSLSENINGNQPNSPLVEKYYPQPVEKETKAGNLLIFSCPEVRAQNLHLPKTFAQVLNFVRLVNKLHNEDGFLHGDIRPPNVLFPDPPDDVDESQEFDLCYLIDFDLARNIRETHRYPANYRSTNLEIDRHSDAVGGGAMNIEHDQFAVIETLKYYLNHAQDIIPVGNANIINGDMTYTAKFKVISQIAGSSSLLSSSSQTVPLRS